MLTPLPMKKLNPDNTKWYNFGKETHNRKLKDLLLKTTRDLAKDNGVGNILSDERMVNYNREFKDRLNSLV